MFKRILSLTVVLFFLLTSIGPLPQAHADAIIGLPQPGTMINLSSSYEPVIIKGLTVHKDNPFLFDFIVDVGQDNLTGEPLKKEGEKLIKYFLASLAIPDKDVWVNLSPYEKDRIIPEVLGQTDMGRDLLEQDYILKQITASLIYPEKQLGKKFWNKVYAEARQKYGTTQIPVNTFNKVWIMADRAEVFEHNQTAFVVDSHLKVMLEEDYLALQKHNVETPFMASHKDAINRVSTTNNISSSILRSIILPELEKEVNKGRNFANLRQIFNSIILSSWYKKNLKEALLNQVYTNQSKIKGIDLTDPTIKEQIYQQYLKAYKKGVFNYIKEDVNQAGVTIPHKYFSGGIFEAGAAKDPAITSNPVLLAQALPDRALVSMTTGFVNHPRSDAAMTGRIPGDTNGDVLKLYNKVPKAKRVKLKKIGEAGAELISQQIADAVEKLTSMINFNGATGRIPDRKKIQSCLVDASVFHPALYDGDIHEKFGVGTEIPPTFVFDGRIFSTYPGKIKPYRIAITLGKDFFTVTTTYSDLPDFKEFTAWSQKGLLSSDFDPKRFLLAKGGVRVYRLGSDLKISLEDKLKGIGTKPLLQETVDLARGMGDKNPPADVFFEGGKTTFILNKDADPQKAIKEWVTSSILAGVLGRLYDAGPDMNSADLMGVLQGQADRVHSVLGLPQVPVTTSISGEPASFDHYQWTVTSISAFESFMVVFQDPWIRERYGIKPKVDLVIQGAGDVGSGLVKYIDERYSHLLKDGTIRIVGMSDKNGGIYDPQGLNIDELLRLRPVKAVLLPKSFGGDLVTFDNVINVLEKRKGWIEEVSGYEYNILVDLKTIQVEMPKLFPDSSEDDRDTIFMDLSYSGISLKDHYKDHGSQKVERFENGSDVFYVRTKFPHTFDPERTVIAFPAAGPGVFKTPEDIQKLKEAGVGMVISPANNPLKEDIGLEAVFEQGNKKILYLGASSVSFGGIYTSTEEIFHNLYEGGLIELRKKVSDAADEWKAYIQEGIVNLTMSLINFEKEQFKKEVQAGRMTTFHDIHTNLAAQVRKNKDFILMHPDVPFLNHIDSEIKAVFDEYQKDGEVLNFEQKDAIALVIILQRVVEEARVRAMYDRRSLAMTHLKMLEGMLADPDTQPESVERIAIYELGKMAVLRAREDMLRIMTDSRFDDTVKSTTAAALVNIGQMKDVPLLRDIARETKSPSLRFWANWSADRIEKTSDLRIVNDQSVGIREFGAKGVPSNSIQLEKKLRSVIKEIEKDFVSTGRWGFSGKETRKGNVDRIFTSENSPIYILDSAGERVAQLFKRDLKNLKGSLQIGPFLFSRGISGAPDEMDVQNTTDSIYSLSSFEISNLKDRDYVRFGISDNIKEALSQTKTDPLSLQERHSLQEFLESASKKATDEETARQIDQLIMQLSSINTVGELFLQLAQSIDSNPKILTAVRKADEEKDDAANPQAPQLHKLVGIRHRIVNILNIGRVTVFHLPGGSIVKLNPEGQSALDEIPADKAMNSLAARPEVIKEIMARFLAHGNTNFYPGEVTLRYKKRTIKLQSLPGIQQEFEKMKGKFPRVFSVTYLSVETSKEVVITLKVIGQSPLYQNKPPSVSWGIEDIQATDLDKAMQSNMSPMQGHQKAIMPGGIDLNTSNGMQWKISKDGKGVEMTVDYAMIDRIRHTGIYNLSPEIYKITPIKSIWPLVGLSAPAA